MNFLNSIEEYFDLVEREFDCYNLNHQSHDDGIELIDTLLKEYGNQWLAGTMGKHYFDYVKTKNKNNLIKICAYCYLVWLKRGFHIQSTGLCNITNINIKIKYKYFNDFCNTIYQSLLKYNKMNTNFNIEYVYYILREIEYSKFENIKEKQIFLIFRNCFNTWHLGE